MLLAELFTMTEIEAPAERVWHILTDFARYPEWNPFIRRIEGEPIRRAALELLIHPDGARPRRFRPHIVTFRPPKELRWRARARLEEPVRRGFDAMNLALKQLAERYA
jgi:hypothetical protein